MKMCPVQEFQKLLGYLNGYVDRVGWLYHATGWKDILGKRSLCSQWDGNEGEDISEVEILISTRGKVLVPGCCVYMSLWDRIQVLFHLVIHIRNAVWKKDSIYHQRLRIRVPSWQETRWYNLEHFLKNAHLLHIDRGHKTEGITRRQSEQTNFIAKKSTHSFFHIMTQNQRHRPL